jgi:hypothetical protein
MSDTKNEVQYEPVPLDEYTDGQLFKLNADKPSGSWEGGAVTLAGGAAIEATKKGLIPASKTAFDFIRAVANRGAPSSGNVEIGPITVEGSATEVPKIGPDGKPVNAVEKWANTQHIDPATGKPLPYLSGGDYSAEHQLQMSAKERAAQQLALDRANAAFEPIPKAVTPPELIPLDPNSPTFMEDLEKRYGHLGEAVEGAPHTGPVEPKPLSRVAQFMENVGNTANRLAEPFKPAYHAIQPALGPIKSALNYAAPVLNPALTAYGYYGAGEQGMEAYKHFNHGNYGRGTVSAIGAIGDLAATRAPHLGAKVVGAGVGMGSHLLNDYIDKKYGRDYATGGLVYINK